MKKVAKKKLEPVKKNDLGIVLENFNDKFGQAMESFSALNGQFKKLDNKVDGLSKQLSDFVVEANQRFNEVDSKFETVFEYLSANNDQGEKINRLEKRVTVIEAKVEV